MAVEVWRAVRGRMQARGAGNGRAHTVVKLALECAFQHLNGVLEEGLCDVLDACESNGHAASQGGLRGLFLLGVPPPQQVIIPFQQVLYTLHRLDLSVVPQLSVLPIGLQLGSNGVLIVHLCQLHAALRVQRAEGRVHGTATALALSGL